MIPIAPIIIIVLRLTGVTGANGATARGIGRNLSWMAFRFLLFACTLALVRAGLQRVDIHGDAVDAAVTFLWSALYFFPAPILRVTTVRLGWPRVTRFAARGLMAYSVSGHYRSGAALLATRAVVRRRSPRLEELAWLDQELRAAKDQGTNAGSRVLLLHRQRTTDAAARERAAAYATVAGLVHPADGVREARVLATSYLFARGAQRGDIERIAVHRFSRRDFAWRSWAVRVLARRAMGIRLTLESIQRTLAERVVLGRGAKPDLEAFEQLLRVSSPRPDDTLSPNLDATSITSLVTALHVSLLRSPRPTVAEVARVLRAWDVFECSAEVATAWDDRKTALGARVDLLEVVYEARKMISGLALAHDLHVAALPTASAACDAVRLHVKGALWEQLRVVTARIAQRRRDDDELEPPDAWLEIGEALWTWDRLKHLEHPLTLYQEFFRPLDGFACWSCGRPLTGDRPLAYAVFHFLRDAAAAAGETAEVRRLTDNMKVALQG